ncbi:MAG: zinc-ribbon domain-containing protein [Gemmatimonadota bacterium]
MNVSCPECHTVYRVDPSKVPEEGVRARCVRCPGEFAVRRTGVRGSPADPSAVAEAEASAAEPAIRPDSRNVASSGDSEEDTSSRESRGIPGAAEPSAIGGKGEESTVVEADEESPPVPFGSSDPHDRAKRLSRALVSDIVVYHPDRRERSLRAGTVRQEFREEIRKSWEEYVTQVGNELARKTPYFKEALNEILAKGARYF